MKRGVLAVVAAVVLVAAGAVYWPVEACVGKTIFVGRLPGRDQAVLAEIFTWMVSERTGTTVQVKDVPDSRAAHAALQAAEIDLYLEDQGVALREILGQGAPAKAGDPREVVRHEYEQRFNLIWLEPWGITGRSTVTVAGPAVPVTPSLVAPVIRKDTLKKFPALSRLVNKLSGAVDNAALARLVQDGEKRPVRDVVKKFLKDKRLI